MYTLQHLIGSGLLGSVVGTFIGGAIAWLAVTGERKARDFDGYWPSEEGE